MRYGELSASPRLDGKIAILEGHELENVSLLISTQLIRNIAGYCFCRIRSRPALHRQEGRTTSDPLEGVLTAIYAESKAFCLAVEHSAGQVIISLGEGSSDSPGSPIIQAVLGGTWGAGHIITDDSLATRLSSCISGSYGGAITGVPSRPTDRLIPITVIDALRRGLGGAPWTYLVVGLPINRQVLQEYRRDLIAETAALRNNPIRDDITSPERRAAEHYASLIEATLKRIELGQQVGAWQVGCFLFGNRVDLRQGLGILSGNLGGNSGAAPPIRIHACSCQGGQPAMATLLTTPEAAILTRLPEEETPGWRIERQAIFDGDPEPPGPGTRITLGHLVIDGAVTTTPLEISIDDLTRHAVVAGATGSGKTTTLKAILRRADVPFLIIEAAKREYRRLLNEPLFADLLIFTLGDETPGCSAPFRLNPFEVPAGTSVQSHIDSLEDLFRASFVFYAPMPYVFKRALHQIYEDKGWDLSANTNRRGEGPASFPTLTDLGTAIRRLVPTLGYDNRLEMDIMAGLLTRIDSLKTGAKGRMLDTRHSLDIDALLERRVVLELGGIGNDDEKAFIIGLLLIRIYRHHENVGQGAKGLRHLLLVEEAHRLLRQMPSRDSETEGTRQKAVEFFSNMLSEIRAFGVGLIVAEQIPTKLAVDVIKNTSLKLMHRLPAADDRILLGAAMLLDENQTRHAATLEVGRAIVFREGMDAPMLVNIVSDSLDGRPVDNGFVCEHMRKAFYDGSPGLLAHRRSCVTCPLLQAGCGLLRERVGGLLSDRRYQEAFNRFYLTLGISGYHAGLFDDLDQLLLERLIGRGELEGGRRCLFTQGADRLLERSGVLFGTSYKSLEQLESAWAAMLSGLAGGSAEIHGLEPFRHLFKTWRSSGEVPFAGCRECQHRCLFRPEAEFLSGDPGLDGDFTDAMRLPDDDRLTAELVLLCREAGERLTGVPTGGASSSAGYCWFVQASARRGYHRRLQERLAARIHKTLFPERNGAASL
jgi:hypothetical protein